MNCAAACQIFLCLAAFFIVCGRANTCDKPPRGLSLEADYNPAKAPKGPDEGALVISSDHVVLEISKVDDFQRQFRMPVTTFRTWRDPRIRLTEPDVDRLHISETFFRQCIWSPNPNFLFQEDREFHESLKLPYTFAVLRKPARKSALKAFNLTKEDPPDPNVFYVEMVSWVQLTVNCKMDFGWYPFDQHNCYVLETMLSRDQNGTKLVGSYAYKAALQRQLQYHVRAENLPESFTGIKLFYYKLSMTGWRLNLKRKISVHLQETFLPTALFVAVSWVSFIIPPESIPGRMALLVTLLLVLVNIFIRVGASSPNSDRMNALSAWVIACILKVACAVIQYGTILTIKRRYSRSKVASEDEDDKDTKHHQLIQRIDDYSLLAFPIVTFAIWLGYWLKVMSVYDAQVSPSSDFLRQYYLSSAQEEREEL